MHRHKWRCTHSVYSVKNKTILLCNASCYKIFNIFQAISYNCFLVKNINMQYPLYCYIVYCALLRLFVKVTSNLLRWEGLKRVKNSISTRKNLKPNRKQYASNLELYLNGYYYMPQFWYECRVLFAYLRMLMFSLTFALKYTLCSITFSPLYLCNLLS